MLYRNALFFILILFLACQSNDTGQNDMVKDLCNCMRPLMDINIKVEGLLDAGKREEAAMLFEQIEKIADEGTACTDELELKYGLVKGEQEEKISKAMQKYCPDIAQMLARSKAMEGR